MTAHQETRYVCDRCAGDEVTSAEGSAPPLARMAGPLDWLMLRVGTDPGAPPKHLCPVCAGLFAAFMKQAPRVD